MQRFRFRALSADGKPVEGEVAAGTWEEAVAKVAQLGHVPVAAEAVDGALRKKGERSARRSGRGATRGQITRWTDQLATLLEADLPIDEALAIIELDDGRAAPRFQASVHDALRRGRPLSEAIAEREQDFPAFYVGLVKAGEARGTLPQTLREIATFLERSVQARRKLRSALAYPLFLIVMACVSVLVILGFVVPNLAPLFQSAGDALPLSTRIILGASALLNDHGLALAGGALGLLLLTAYALRRPKMQPLLDRLTLRLPLLGGLLTKVEAARVLRTLGALLGQGVAGLEALSAARGASGNSVFRREIDRVTEAVRAGAGIGEELRRGGLFPVAAVRMAMVGERSGRLAEMLSKAGEALDGEAQQDAERLIAWLTPVLTLVLGVAIGGVALSLVTAIMSINNGAL